MRKIVFRTLFAGLLVACLGASTPASAVSFEDSLDDCSYPKLFDVTVLRPISFSALIIGSALFVPVAPFAAVTVPDDFHHITNDLVAAPARFTFKRPLGECTGVTLAY
jgi:hypothetical protein